MSWWYNTPSQTITVWEDPPETYSLVLGPDGEPYKLVSKRKIGFDLTPRNKQDASETNREACFSLQKS